MSRFRDMAKKIPFVVDFVRKCRSVREQAAYKKSLAQIQSTKAVLVQRHAQEPGRKIVVVFVIQIIQPWIKLKPIYEKLKQNSDFKTYLVCVPSLWNEKRVVANSIHEDNNDTYEYFKDHGYECIDSRVGNTWFDLKKLEPDYVFHSRPYNHFMPKEYNSSAISKYALLCNILYGTTLTVNEVGPILNMNYFKDVLCYFAFDKYEVELYNKKFRLGLECGIQKCLPFGTTGLEQILSAKKEKNSTNFNKMVMWTPRFSTDPNIGGSNFFRYKETIKELVGMYRDVLFIIRPHPLMFGNFISTGEMTQEEVDNFKNYCSCEPNVKLDESKEYASTFWQSDFIIADSSGIVPEYYVTNKPIIFCNPVNVNYKYNGTMLSLLSHSYVVNSIDELKSAFRQLYEERDNKLEERKKSIITMFGDIKNSSNNIIRTLKMEIRA